LKVKRSRRRPSVKVTADGRGVVSHAGTKLLADVAERAGLAGDLGAAVAPVVTRRRRHDPGDVLVDLAVMLADGGECVSDLKVLRAQCCGFPKFPTVDHRNSPGVEAGR